MRLSFVLLATFLSLFASQAYAAAFTGKLVKVLDGDTVEVMHDGKAERIRLAQIDCPEKGQPFGQAAKQYVLDIAALKIVTVQVETVDRYGRTVGEVLLPDGANLNKQIVGAGYAWQYKKYSKEPEYAELEAGAMAAKRGLWQESNPVPPWEWRKGIRSGDESPKAKSTSTVSPYHGNTNSRVFHGSACRHYSCKNCVENFDDKEVAIAAGYKACGMCRP